MALVGCSTGLDRFVEEGLSSLREARIGLIANPASVDSSLVHAVERFGACRDPRLTAIFGPQHGACGDQQDNMIESEHSVDRRLGIPIYSLYGEHRKPTPEMLANIDVLICDLPDVGTRPYTFLSTMLLSMQACAEHGKRFVVLDRPNPVAGIEVEGNVLDPRFRSFIGVIPLPMRHGMTMGEIARMANQEYAIGVELEVVTMKGWRRQLYQDQTTVPWVMPSPNMPSVETAVVYPGTVLVEGTNLSEGRGSCRPFEIVGAPFLDADAFSSRLNRMRLPGVRFRPSWFRPTFDKWQGELCGGIQLHVTNREEFRPFRTGLAILKSALELAPGEFAWRKPPFEYEFEKLPIEILCGTNRIHLELKQCTSIEGIEATWEMELSDFRRSRQRYLLY